MHTKPISAVDQGRPSLGFFDKVTEEMRLGVVEHLDAALGYDATVIGLELLDVEPKRSRQALGGLWSVSAPGA